MKNCDFFLKNPISQTFPFRSHVYNPGRRQGGYWVAEITNKSEKSVFRVGEQAVKKLSDERMSMTSQQNPNRNWDIESAFQRYKECLAHQTLETWLEKHCAVPPHTGWQMFWLIDSICLFFFNDTKSLSSMNHYIVPKECPERSHHFLKPTARVKDGDW